MSLESFLGARIWNPTQGYLATRGASQGIAVLFVEENSVAARVGLRPSDVVTKVRKIPVRNIEEFRKVIDAADRKQSIDFEIVRDGITRTIQLKIN
jgi:serine protease Do